MARGQHRHVIVDPKRSAKDRLISAAFFVEEIVIFLVLVGLVMIMHEVRSEAGWIYSATIVVCLVTALIVPLLRGRLRLLVQSVMKDEKQHRAGHRVTNT